MSDGAGGPIIEPGGQGHFHGGSDVIAKKVQVKTFVIQAPSIYKVGFPLEMCQTFLILFFI